MKLEALEKLCGFGLTPSHEARVVYRCIGCGANHPLERLLYTCPECGSLLRIEDLAFDELKKTPGKRWRDIFDLRRSLKVEGLSGIFLFHELILPSVPLSDVIYLGEGHTPMIKANADLSDWLGSDFFVKNDGQNPSASFKDRGMASAISFLNNYIKTKNPPSVLGICASTGDTSAAAALYLSYLPKDKVKSVVLLPRGRVTTQQLGQPLGSGATVIEVPGVFDDCMKLVEKLAEGYEVFLLNSKNPVRICGQKSFAYEVAQALSWEVADATVVVPIGNAGNVTAVMEGFVTLLELGIINELPRLLGVQSERANPVARWRKSGSYAPMEVTPSVAQAAMIGNPVSFPKVKGLVEKYFDSHFDAVSVSEQEIMDSMLTVNRHGNVVCTQGGEAVAGLKKALAEGVVSKGRTFVCDSTSHQLKFAGFQESYFSDALTGEYGVVARAELVNRPVGLPADASAIAAHLGLRAR